MKSEDIEGGTLETWTADEVFDAYQRREIALIDVRTPQEYMFEHIEGALLLPMPFFEADKLPSQQGKKLVFYCGSSARSKKVSTMYLAGGAKLATHLEGGFAAWKQSGKPHIGTDMATGAPKRVAAKS